jgi:hypothetical protein
MKLCWRSGKYFSFISGSTTGYHIPRLLLREPTGSFEFCRCNVFTLKSRYCAIVIESVQFWGILTVCLCSGCVWYSGYCSLSETKIPQGVGKLSFLRLQVDRGNEPTLMGPLSRVIYLSDAVTSGVESGRCLDISEWHYRCITSLHQFILRLRIRQNMCWAWSGRAQVDINCPRWNITEYFSCRD